MGAKITQKALATANAAMALPVDNSGFDNHTTVESIVLDYGRDVENMIQGDGLGGVITSPSGTGTVTIPQWRNTWPLTSAAGIVTPDLQRSATFSLTLTENTEIQLPDNITQTGGMFRIYVQQDGTGNWALTFSATGNRYKILPDSQGLNFAAAGRSIVEVYLFSATVLPCRVIPIYGNSQQFGISGLIPFKTTITSAQVLTGNTTPITFVPALGANLVAVLVELYYVFDYNTIPYATFTDWEIGYPLQTVATGLIDQTASIIQNINVLNVAQLDIYANAALLWSVPIGNPTAGNSDITYYGYYRIIDLS